MEAYGDGRWKDTIDMIKIKVGRKEKGSVAWRNERLCKQPSQRKRKRKAKKRQRRIHPTLRRPQHTPPPHPSTSLPPTSANVRHLFSRCVVPPPSRASVTRLLAGAGVTALLSLLAVLQWPNSSAHRNAPPACECAGEYDYALDSEAGHSGSAAAAALLRV